ncbi:MAG TPA: hypothetical protein VEF53_18970 [Patescibacteria group bacterium]|nr:hypothetical protein [Patescibacteria group bacterium]
MLIKQDKQPFKVNIQLFAEGDEPVNYNGVEGDVLAMLQAEGNEPLVQPTDEQPIQPITEPQVQEPQEPSTQPTEPIQQPVEPVQPQPPQPSQNELLLMQQLQQMQQAMAQQQQQFQQFMQQQTMPQQPPQVQKTPEEMEAERQAIVDELLQDPMGVLNRVVQQAVNPLQQEIEGYKQKEVWGTAKSRFAKMVDETTGQPLHPDYESVAERMEQIMQERPGIAMADKPLWALKNAYDIAMAEKYRSQPPVVQQPPVSIVDQLKDPNNIKQLISNPDIMKALAAAQAQQQAQLNQQVPPIAPSSGAANAAPYIQPKPQSYNDLDSEVLNALKQGIV